VKRPAPAVGLLLRILEEMARGNAVTIIRVHAELTTREAADMLNISQRVGPYRRPLGQTEPRPAYAAVAMALLPPR
jgi:hypothetical protein